MTVYRGTLIISAVPFLLRPEWFTELLVVRAAICMAFLISVLAARLEVFPLQLRNSFLYVSISHLAYFGTLLLITFVLKEEPLKYWYVGTQIGLGLLLKRLDFTIRGSPGTAPYLHLLTSGIAIAIVAPLMSLWASVPAMVAYLTGALAITQLNRFVR